MPSGDFPTGGGGWTYWPQYPTTAPWPSTVFHQWQNFGNDPIEKLAAAINRLAEALEKTKP